MPKIVRIHAREVLDSRGKPTVEAEVHLEGGIVGRASVPSGASTGAAEACELRDKDHDWYDRQGVQQAVRNVILILGPKLANREFNDQEALDECLINLDGTPNKERLGANAVLAVSIAWARAAAAAANKPLYHELWWHYLLRRGVLGGPEFRPRMPLPMVNMISGGKHAGGNLDFQDVLIIPAGAQLSHAARVDRTGLSPTGHVAVWRGITRAASSATKGVMAPSSRRIVRRSSCRPSDRSSGASARPRRDACARCRRHALLSRRGRYYLAAEQGQRLSSSQMIDRLEGWAREFPIATIEDGLAENDWDGWQELTARLGSQVKLVGDDLFATNEKLLARGIETRAANAVLIKVNQIGTLSETLRTMLLARQHDYACIASARSGETEDDFLADLAVGTAADYIKVGGVARSERLAKYNRLLRIAEEL
jgi:enolase